MREAVPKPKIIEAGFRVLAKRLARVQRSINSEAARSMRAGQYEAVQRWMEVGKNVSDFAGRLDAFAEEWKRLVKATRIAGAKKPGPSSERSAAASRKKATPASRFYEPAIRALAGRGGEATPEQLIQDLETSVGAELNDADRKTAPRRGLPRWHATLGRAYRDSVREGWLEKRRDGVWKITEKGKQVAAARRGAR
ncbi:MAG: hypothetical protein HYR73_03005 [Candidatus Eisenbacteria bacterium]|nr:hypothetical protein [Candidatus Eisenbacteria bacterium]